jgi:hypothetical protein
MVGRKFITRDMLTAAREKGWSVSLTAAHYEMHPKSISSACERFGIALPMHKFSPAMPSQTRRSQAPEANDTRTPAVWSCSPAAIERAIKRLGV